MKINIDDLTEPELLDLNHKVVERLKFIRQAHAQRKMLEFRIGDRVSFEPEGRGTKVGILTKYNRKSVTVITEDGGHWTVPPCYIKRVEQTESPPQQHQQIMKLLPTGH